MSIAVMRPRARFGRDDAAARVELHRGRHVESVDEQLCLAVLEVVHPDLVGEHLREVEPPVGAHHERVRSVQILHQEVGFTLPRGIELHQPAARTELVDEQPPPAVIHGDAVGAGQVVAHDPVRAIRVPRRHPPDEWFGRVERAVGAEDGVVGPHDAPAERREQLVFAGFDVDRRHLRAEHLRDVEAPVRPDRHAVAARQPARPGDQLEHEPVGHSCRSAAVHLPTIGHRAPSLCRRIVFTRTDGNVAKNTADRRSRTGHVVGPSARRVAEGGFRDHEQSGSARRDHDASLVLSRCGRVPLWVYRVVRPRSAGR